MGKIAFRFSLPIIVLVLCTSSHLMAQQAGQTVSSSSEQTKAIAGLKKQVETLTAKVAALESQKESMLYRIFMLESSQNREIELDLSSRQYQRLDSSNGMFLVSVQNAATYLDGYKVTLDIGNTSAARFKGFTLKVKWGKKYDYANFDAASYARWSKEMQTKDISFAEELRPGAWNRVEVILSSTAADQLGYFVVAVKTNTISLSSAN